jgi:hypothetical protein
MVTVTGKLQSAINSSAVQGQVEVMLCGYGSRVPRHNGVALVARIEDDEITIAADGSFTFSAPPNDEITPIITYYAVTIKDENGDIAQVNAYRFLSTPPTYDLNLIDPYDPNLPPPPLPPIITNMLLVIAAAAAMNFPGDVYVSFKTTLSGNVTTPTVSGMIPGNLYTFIIVQDATGGHTFAWPAEIHNAVMIAYKPNATTIQTFVCDENGELWPVGPAPYQ